MLRTVGHDIGFPHTVGINTPRGVKLIIFQQPRITNAKRVGFDRFVDPPPYQNDSEAVFKQLIIFICNEIA